MPTFSISRKKSDKKIDARNFCPYCDNKTLKEEARIYEGETNTYPLHYHVIRRCAFCKKLSFIHSWDYRTGGSFPVSQTTIANLYPLKSIAETLTMQIPAKIKADYVEGIKALGSGCIKSACVMFRRAVQNAVIELGASKRKKLEDQIDQLERKRIITPELKDLAHEMRVVGNLGAHPLKDEFDQLKREDAIEMESFLKEFINYCFVLRKRLQDRKIAKTKKEVSEDTEKAGDSNDH